MQTKDFLGRRAPKKFGHAGACLEKNEGRPAQARELRRGRVHCGISFVGNLQASSI